MQRDEDPRDYKVSFEKIRRELGFEPLMRVPDGVAEVVAALEERRFGDPFDPRYPNLTSGEPSSERPADAMVPLFDLRLTDADVAAVEETLRSGWLTMGPRTRPSSARSPSISACRTRSRCPAAPPPCTWPTWPPGSARATR